MEYSLNYLECIVIWSRKKVQVIFGRPITSGLLFNQLIYLKGSTPSYFLPLLLSFGTIWTVKTLTRVKGCFQFKIYHFSHSWIVISLIKIRQSVRCNFMNSRHVVLSIKNYPQYFIKLCRSKARLLINNYSMSARWI